MTAPTRILLVRLSHLGDVVHALPVFHALRAAHPRARLGWVVQPEFAGVLDGLPGLDEVLTFERRGGAAAWPRLRERLAGFDAQWVVDAQGNWKSAVVCLAAGAPRRSGLARADWRERGAAVAMTDRAPRATDGPHAIDRMRALARHVAPGVAVDDGPRLPLSAAVRDAGRAELARRLGGGRSGGERAPVLVSIGRADDPRSYPPASLADVARRLADAGAPVLVVSGPAEREVGAALADRVADARVDHWVGQRGLPQLAALFAAAAERGGALLSGDSGPAHLAAAVGLPVVCLAGPQDAARTGPWPPPLRDAPRGPGHRVLRADPAPDCAPCFLRRCTHADGNVCLSGLSAARVADELLRATAPSA